MWFILSYFRHITFEKSIRLRKRQKCIDAITKVKVHCWKTVRLATDPHMESLPVWSLKTSTNMMAQNQYNEIVSILIDF